MTKDTNRFSIDNSYLVDGNLDVVAFILREIKAKYGPDAILGDIHMTTQHDFLKNCTIVTVDVLIPED